MKFLEELTSGQYLSGSPQNCLVQKHIMIQITFKNEFGIKKLGT